MYASLSSNRSSLPRWPVHPAAWVLVLALAATLVALALPQASRAWSVIGTLIALSAAGVWLRMPLAAPSGMPLDVAPAPVPTDGAPRLDPHLDVHLARDAAHAASSRLAPVWADLIETARAETEASIIDLTTRFGNIVSGLDRAIASADASGRAAAVDLVERQGREQLASLVDELRASCTRERAMRDEVEALYVPIEQLRQGADAVHAVAKRATLLSLNAAIEAARAGDSGAGFAVVAAEMQRLSMASGELGQDMARRSADAIFAMSAAVQAVRESVDQTENTVRSAEERVARVLDDHASLARRIAQSGAALSASATDVNASVADAIVALQFQDRTSQILTHVRDSIRRAPDSVFARQGEIDAAPELDALAHTYATQEERVVHQGGVAALPASQDITFF
jgi:methyl-accepting chemotaxis protein